MAALTGITAVDLIAALGATPPGSPTAQGEHRATRQVVRDALAQLNLAQQQQPPPVVVQPQPIQVFVARPRVGGTTISGGHVTAWVGGGTAPGTVLAGPLSVKAYRSTDLSIQMKTEKACAEGLAESRRLPQPGAMDANDLTSVVSLTDWIRAISTEIKDCGMDTVFRAMINNEEVYLIEKWGQATKVNVDAHLVTLRTINDPYDIKNLSLSAKFLLNSLDDSMLKRVEQELGHSINAEVTGPDVFRAVIGLHSVLNDSTERFYIEKLQKMKLKEEPGEDVSTFSNKVVSMAHHINGLTGRGVSDLHVLVYTTFRGCLTEEFAQAVSHLLSQCLLGLGTPANFLYDWERQVGLLLIMYRDLKSRNMWEALKHVKETNEAQGLLSKQVAVLTAEVQRLTRVQGTQANTGTTIGGQITCFTCGEVGHKSPQCPNKPSGTGTGTFKAREAPKDGEEHTKVHGGTTYKWCGICKRWNQGAKAHLTAEHVKRPAASGQLAGGHSSGTTDVPTSESACDGEVVGGLSRVMGFLSTTEKPIVPLKPVITRDMRYITSAVAGGSWAIEDQDACLMTTPGAIYCETCRQHSLDPLHNHSTVHAYNMYIALEWDRNQALAELQDMSPSKVIGFVGSITNIANSTSIEEEDKKQAAEKSADLAKWLCCDVDGSYYCRVCDVPVLDADQHERTNDHFQARVLSSMTEWFSTNRFAPLMGSDDVEDEASAVEEALEGKTEEASSVVCVRLPENDELERRIAIRLRNRRRNYRRNQQRRLKESAGHRY